MINLEKKFKSTYKELCLISLFYLKDINEAEDVVQDIFVKIIEKKNLDEIKNLNSYLKIAVKNASLKRISQYKKLQTIDENAFFYNESATFEVNDLALKKKIQLYKKIEELPKQCKKVFLLCVLDDLKYQEVANQLGISINTVKTQMKKAFKTLRTELRDTYYLVFIAR